MSTIPKLDPSAVRSSQQFRPMIISRAPVRISFLGGGTDYPEYFAKDSGAVLATAIDKYSYICTSPFASQFFDYSIRVSYRKVETADSLELIQHNVYRECMKLCGLEKDIEIHNIADLPAFTGLGSSSAFTVSLLHALHSFKGEFYTPAQLAYEAIHVERNILHENVGCQDQVLAAHGGFNLIEFRSEDNIQVNRVPITPIRQAELESYIILIFTGIKRVASDVVSHQLQRINQNLRVLRQMRAMVDEGYRILTGNVPLTEFGKLLQEAWLAKKSLDNGISNPEIDEMYQRGMNAGALGGKLLGAGSGGFILFITPPENQEALIKAFPGKAILRVKTNAPGSQIIFS